MKFNPTAPEFKSASGTCVSGQPSLNGADIDKVADQLCSTNVNKSDEDQLCSMNGNKSEAESLMLVQISAIT